MSDDGADIGYSPLQGMRGALGGEQVAEQDRIKDMAEYLDTAPTDIWTYDDAARSLGKSFLSYLRSHPEARDLPIDDEGAFEFEDNGDIKPNSYRVVRLGLYSVAKEAGYLPDNSDGYSGFQVGWAGNAARTALDLPPVQNPAIVDIGG